MKYNGDRWKQSCLGKNIDGAHRKYYEHFVFLSGFDYLKSILSWGRSSLIDWFALVQSV